MNNQQKRWIKKQIKEKQKLQMWRDQMEKQEREFKKFAEELNLKEFSNAVFNYIKF